MNKNETQMIPTKNPEFFLRMSTPDDCGLVVDYMRKLGTFQKMRDAIVATPEGIRRLLEQGRGEAIFGYYQGKLVAMMYYCENSSAFIGQSGIYIDGLYVDEEMRGKGLGNILIAFISNLALERGHKRLEWGCLDWNEPAIQLYRKLGAKCVDIMRIYRFNEETMHSVGERFYTPVK